MSGFKGGERVRSHDYFDRSAQCFIEGTVAGIGPHPDGETGLWLEIDVDRDVHSGVESTGPDSRVGTSVYTPVGGSVELLRN